MASKFAQFLNNIESKSLAELLNSIEPRPLAAEDLKRIIADANVPGASVDPSALAIDLAFLRVLLEDMPKKYRGNARRKASAISSAAERLQKVLKEGALSLLPVDDEEDSYVRTIELLTQTMVLTQELKGRAEHVLQEPGAANPWRPRLSKNDIVSGPMAAIFEHHFQRGVGTTTPKPGGDNTTPGGAFIRFVRSSVKVLAPSRITRFTPNMIREALKNNPNEISFTRAMVPSALRKLSDGSLGLESDSFCEFK